MIRKFTYNNRVLTAEERVEYCRQADECIDQYSKCTEDVFQLAKIVSLLGNSDFSKINKTILDILTFITYAFCDCIVLDKLFIMASHPYEKSLLRGKLKVHLNESFKKLYGFKKDYKNSYCAQLEKIMPMFPEFQEKFDELMSDFEQISKEPWWKEERNAEVHIDAAKLYALRHEEINESKVSVEATQLIGLFNSIHFFIVDLYGADFRYIVTRERQ